MILTFYYIVLYYTICKTQNDENIISFKIYSILKQLYEIIISKTTVGSYWLLLSTNRNQVQIVDNNHPNINTESIFHAQGELSWPNSKFCFSQELQKCLGNKLIRRSIHTKHNQHFKFRESSLSKDPKKAK